MKTETEKRKEIIMKDIASSLANLAGAFNKLCAGLTVQREQDSIDAGHITPEMNQARKNRRSVIRHNSEEAMREMIDLCGVISDCCGAAVMRNFNGDTICAECLEACNAVEVKR